ncbi:hypothetical protein [Curtobacterium sp. NPDC089689]|uniref:hypothetical protein n=1 Tax=Curtobacterium sp. NPDC089689 TaxID=3363968 RepID=UPI0037F4D38F
MTTAANAHDVERARRVTHLRRTLLEAAPGSSVRLRGSLARGTADAWSDIDLSWNVDQGDDALAALPHALRGVGPVESLRLDPDRAASSRLVFVRFHGWSLFQRVDIDVVGRFGPDTPSWAGARSSAESALMNVVAALRASHRGRGDVDGLVLRGFERVGGTDAGGATVRRLRRLIDASVAADPAQAALAERVRAEVRIAFDRGDDPSS